jgi:hypothetical protein
MPSSKFAAPAQISYWHIAMNRRALNFRSLSGVLQTWMGERLGAETDANDPAV